MCLPVGKGRGRRVADAVVLCSDFRDVYDHWFTSPATAPPEAVIYERMSRGGLSRPAMYAYLQAQGYPVPRNGSVATIVDRRDLRSSGVSPLPPALWQLEYSYLRGHRQVVVYLDLWSHRGEQKRLMSEQEALRRYPEHFASRYLAPPGPAVGSFSYRYLRLGARAWWLRYESHTDWRSNCGDPQITVLAEEEVVSALPWPLYAFDYVTDGQQWWVVDFNCAPQIKGTGLEDRVPAPVMASLLEEAILARGTGPDLAPWELGHHHYASGDGAADPGEQRHPGWRVLESEEGRRP